MSNPIRTLVVGVSAPTENDLALLAAARLARRTGAALHVVLAFTPPPVAGPPFLEPAGLGYASAHWLLDHAESLRERLQAAVRRVPGAEAAVAHTVAGPAAGAILDVAAQERADLVVVGAARPERLGAFFLGTTAHRVLRGAAVPVLVVRRPPHAPLRRVLLTTDLSELSAGVHEQGLDVVGQLFGTPGAVRSLLVLPFLIVPSPLPRQAVLTAARDEVRAFLAARHAPGAVEPAVRCGAPGDEIAAEARDWDADLLVVGTHARGWAARRVLGSVAEAAIRDAPCNVLAVPPRALAAEHDAPAAEHAMAPPDGVTV